MENEAAKGSPQSKQGGIFAPQALDCWDHSQLLRDVSITGVKGYNQFSPFHTIHLRAADHRSSPEPPAVFQNKLSAKISTSVKGRLERRP
jgi:hypothetical protein